MTISIAILAIGIIWLGFSFLDLLFVYKLHGALGYGAIFVKNISLHAIALYSTALVIAILFPMALISLKKVAHLYIYRGLSLLSIVMGWLVGLAIGNINATDWLLYFHHQLFHKSYPIFHLDYAFYVYQLPIIQSLIGRVGFLICALIIIQIGIFLFQINQVPSRILIRSYRWIARTLALLFIVFAAGTFFSKYTKLFTDSSSIPFVNWVSVILYIAVAAILIVVSFKNEEAIQLSNFDAYGLPIFSVVGNYQ